MKEFGSRILVDNNALKKAVAQIQDQLEEVKRDFQDQFQRNSELSKRILDEKDIEIQQLQAANLQQKQRELKWEFDKGYARAKIDLQKQEENILALERDIKLKTGQFSTDKNETIKLLETCQLELK